MNLGEKLKENFKNNENIFKIKIEQINLSNKIEDL